MQETLGISEREHLSGVVAEQSSAAGAGAKLVSAERAEQAPEAKRILVTQERSTMPVPDGIEVNHDEFGQWLQGCRVK